MNRILCFLFLLIISIPISAQKDSLRVGDRYADDQIYASISYSQFINQPSVISKSDFSYGISFGFIKDIILNKSGTISFAAGVGYGYDYFKHELKVEQINGSAIFSNDETIDNNVLKSHNLEFPFEFRWRKSTINRYRFWRIYSGFKVLYNLSNKFQFDDANNTTFKFSNVEAFNKLQYGLTFSAGYDAFNIHVFYGLNPVFKDSTIQNESIETKILKFGLIFYIL